jgi:hypothetical protein
VLLLPAQGAAPGAYAVHTQQQAAVGGFSASRAPLLPSQGEEAAAYTVPAQQQAVARGFSASRAPLLPSQGEEAAQLAALAAAHGLSLTTVAAIVA